MDFLLSEQRDGHSEKKERGVRRPMFPKKKRLEDIQLDLYGWKLRFQRDKGRDSVGKAGGSKVRSNVYMRANYFL